MTEELYKWVHDPRPYKGTQKVGWLSLLEDFGHSVTLTGPEVTQAVSPELSNVQSLAATLSSTISTSKESVVAAYLATTRPVAQFAVEALLQRLGSADIRRAAWRDMVQGCSMATSSRDIIASRRDFFWDLLRAADYDIARLSLTLCGVLADLKHDIDAAQIWLGDVQAADVDRASDFHQLAGTSYAHRLALCERLTTAAARSAHHVVWLAYENAAIHRVDVGSQFSFYGAKWVRDNLERGTGPNYDSLPNELKSSGDWFSYRDLPDDGQVELVRVDLDVRQLTDPIQTAREEADRLVTLASHRIVNPRWRRLDGYLHVINGQITGIGVFRNPDPRARQRSYHPPDHMHTALKDLAQGLAGRLPISDKNLIEVIDAVHQWQEARKQSVLSSIILNVRILEMLAARVAHTSWHAYLDEYFAESWVRDRMRFELETVVGWAVNVHHIEYPLPESTLQELVQLKQSIFLPTPGGGTNVDLRAALAAIPRLTSLFAPREQFFGRRLHTLATRVGSVPAATTWRDEIMSE
ncbi:hypothetical protein ACU635_02390 [[Actinomadura] parvosata]|uniref:hypothetical protein n=1 Tax=[Actinomadura] parvosata TaxID=1955412 RepID=UPI00406C285F